MAIYSKGLEKGENGLNEVEKSKEQERREYNLKVLRQVQAIFGHLSESKLQFHVPRGFWKSFRYKILQAILLLLIFVLTFNRAKSCIIIEQSYYDIAPFIFWFLNFPSWLTL